jgi:hypothetical protein
MDAPTAAAAVRMINTSVVRVHQHGARGQQTTAHGPVTRRPAIHTVVDANGLPYNWALHSARLMTTNSALSY